MHVDILVGIATFALVAVTIASIVVTLKIWKGQEDLQRELAARTEAFQKELSANAELFQNKLADETQRREAAQRVFEQRTQLIPLWQYMSSLGEIKQASPTTEVVQAINTLELVGLCKEAEVVDRDVILRAFGETFIALYEAIKSRGRLEGLKETGESLLAKAIAATRLYNELIAERLQQHLPPPLDRNK